MDYIFRWLQLRFLSGTQLTLFTGLGTQPPQLPAPPSLVPDPDEVETNIPGVSSAALTRLVEDIARRLNQVGSSQEHHSVADLPLVPEARPTAKTPEPSIRGLFHASDAMRQMYDMGDAPSCQTCGAIMVRNGSCYRCMSCGSTSGCS